MASLGLALSGGSARGLAHIGVLEALHEIGVVPTYVSGTSIGALVGALYARSGSPLDLREQARAIIAGPEFRALNLGRFYAPASSAWQRFKKELFEKFYLGRLLFRESHLHEDKTRRIFSSIFGDLTFRDLRLSFICNALDIRTGEEILFDHGALADAVWASCAIPGIFHPRTADARVLIDGGMTNNIPVEPVRRLGARTVIAAYLGSVPYYTGPADTGFKINSRALAFTRYRLDQRILGLADAVINPDLSDFHWADFSRLDELVEIGRQAVFSARDRIRSVTSPWYRVRKLFRR